MFEGNIVKQPKWFILIKATVFVLLFVSMAFIVLSFFDLRSEEQKLKDEREEFLSTAYVSEAIESAKVLLNEHFTNGIAINIQYITVLHTKQYVRIAYTNTNSIVKNFYYDYGSNDTISEWVYENAINQVLVNNIYTGNKRKVSTTFEGDILYKIIQEAKN